MFKKLLAQVIAAEVQHTWYDHF